MGDLIHQANPGGAGGQCKSQSAFYKCTDETFLLETLGQVRTCLFNCSAGKISVYLLSLLKTGRLPAQ